MTRTLDWRHAGAIWRDRANRETARFDWVATPADLRRAGLCVVTARGFLRVCVRAGWYWVAGVETRDGQRPVCVVVKSDIRYRGDADVIVEPVG